jgi:Tfp pilus assembly protein PilF
MESSFSRACFSISYLVAIALLPSVSTPLQAAERWIKLTTPHFEMYTTNSAKEGTQALKVFEQVRYFFLQSSSSKTAPETPVRIVAFKSEKEYKPYRVNEGAFAYYLRSRKRDYIVMQDISSEHHQAAIHEYTHLIVEHLDLKLPVWLNEGMADLYSSLEPKGNQALVGRPLEGRLAELANQKWLDMAVLLSVNQDSPYYNERQKMSIFYAQSWALVHMIELGKAYGPDFSKFLNAIASGRSAPECFQSVYGKSLSQVNDDLRIYFKQATVRGALFDVKLMKSDLEPEVTDLSDFQSSLALADLLASQKRTMSEASQRLLELAKSHPESVDIQESLGYLAWQQGNIDQAREHFSRAYAEGSQDPDMLFHYAQFLRVAKAPDSEIIEVLTRVVAIKPDHTDALMNLGMTQMQAHKFGVALVSLSRIKTVKPDHAFALFAAIAYCDLELKNPGQAKVMAEKAKQYAQSPDQQFQISNFLRHLDTLDKPLQ